MSFDAIEGYELESSFRRSQIALVVRYSAGFMGIVVGRWGQSSTLNAYSEPPGLCNERCYLGHL